MNTGGKVEARGVTVAMVHADHSPGDWSAEGKVPLYYDSYGHVRAATHQLGATNRFRNDRFGRLLEAIDALGRRVSVTYNADGKPATVTDATGRVLTPAYNAQGLPASVALAQGGNNARSRPTVMPRRASPRPSPNRVAP